MDDKWKLTEADWEPYFGNNHIQIKPPEIYAGGHISFARHLGKPLSQALWEDLIHRMCITGLCIYKHNMPEWTIGWLSGHCCVRLDDKELVIDIHYMPIQRLPSDDLKKLEAEVERLLALGKEGLLCGHGHQLLNLRLGEWKKLKESERTPPVL